MVSVDVNNINDLLSEIEANIASAAFVAVDTEFSGLNIGKSSEESRFDQAEQRYDRYRQNVRAASLLQLGLACYIRSTKEDSAGDDADASLDRLYKVVAYNIILAPADLGLARFRPKNLITEWSAMKFLSNHGFDLNRVIKDGVPFVDVQELQQVAKKLSRGISVLRDSDFDRDAYRTGYAEAQGLQTAIEAATSSGQPQEFHGLKSSPLVLHCLLREMFPLIWTMPSTWSSMQVQFVNVAQRSALERNDRSVEEWVLRESSIAGRIFLKLVQERKLLQDLMFVVDAFFGCLPDKYDAFKLLVGDLFPHLFDGKVIVQALSRHEKINRFGHFDAPSLGELFSTLTSEKSRGAFQYASQLQHDVRHIHYASENRAHEAGYDAFMAGAVFLHTVFALNADKASDVRNEALLASARPGPNVDTRVLGRDPTSTMHGLPPLMLRKTSLDMTSVAPYSGLLYLHLSADKFVNVFGADEQAPRSKAWVKLTSGNELIPISTSVVVRAYLEACTYEHSRTSDDEIIVACPSADRAEKMAEYAKNFLGVKAAVYDSLADRKSTTPSLPASTSLSRVALGTAVAVIFGVTCHRLLVNI